MVILSAVLTFISHPYMIPVWGAVSALSIHLFNVWQTSSKNKLEEKKLNLTEVQGDRQQDREDFQVIKDSLYSEIDRLKVSQAETTSKLEESNEETQKCEQRYFELATQYRELLKYCATLSKRVRELEAKFQAEVSRSKRSRNDKRRTNQETTGHSDE